MLIACFHRARLGAVLIALLALTPFPALAQTRPGDLKLISLDELLKLQVTSVSKREQTFSEAPSAIFVITNDDIRQSGATTIAEVLRMVPGLQVAHIDANKWAISSRGFNGRFADKMLVLIDGRSVYTPLFSGVYWDIQDTALQDVDRIEVIRGPGATLWGANAVNGVINIITKHTRNTHGGAVSLTSGNDEHAVLEGRYGASVGSSADVRVFMKYFDREPAVMSNGQDASDSWDMWRGGFRLDWDASPDDAFVLQGESYNGTAGQAYGPVSLLPFFSTPTTTRASLTGGHILGRWTRALSTRTDIAAQAYYDRTNRGEALLDEKRETADADFQSHLRLGRNHDVVGGLGYRVSSDRIQNGRVVRFSRTSRRDGLFSAFIQDEITLVPNRLRITGGTKVEHNSYTSWEFQPDARAILMLDRGQAFWGAISRAVRTPSRAESDVMITAAPMPGPGGLPLVTSLIGSPAFESETLRAHEIGYRVQPDPHVSLDVAAFYNLYDHLRTFEPGSPRLQLTPSGPQLAVPVLFGNLMEGNTRGIEFTANVKPTSGWRIDATYSYLRVALAHQPGSLDTFGIIGEDNSPRHQARLHSAVTFGGRLEADASVARVGDLTRTIRAYTRVDGRLGWNVAEPLTFAVGARNLLDSDHVEFTSALGEVPTPVRRSVFLNVNWRF